MSSRRIAHDAVVADDDVLADVGVVADLAVAADDGRAFDHRAVLDHRAFADEDFSPMNATPSQRLCSAGRRLASNVVADASSARPRRIRSRRNAACSVWLRSNRSAGLNMAATLGESVRRRKRVFRLSLACPRSIGIGRQPLRTHKEACSDVNNASITSLLNCECLVSIMNRH